MKNTNILQILTVFLLVLVIASPVYAESDQEKRDDILKMERETLNTLYSKEPSAKKHVQSAAGFAVFSNFGMKIFTKLA